MRSSSHPPFAFTHDPRFLKVYSWLNVSRWHIWRFVLDHRNRPTKLLDNFKTLVGRFCIANIKVGQFLMTHWPIFIGWSYQQSLVSTSSPLPASHIARVTMRQQFRGNALLLYNSVNSVIRTCAKFFRLIFFNPKPFSTLTTIIACGPSHNMQL